MAEMERKFGELTLDELKKACEICLDTNRCCSDECPMNGIDCNEATNKSVLELIKSYEGLKETYTDLLRWYWSVNKKYNDFLKQNNEYLEQIKKLEADNLELKDKAEKYEAVHGELIRTQVRLRDVQNEFNAKVQALTISRENVESLKSERKDLNIQLYDANAAKKRLEEENKALNDQLERGVDTIYRLTKEKNEANEALFHYRTLMNSLRFIGKVMFDDQSGDHEKD